MLTFFPNKKLKKYAEERAEELRTTNHFDHPKDSTFGENLYKITYSREKPEVMDSFECKSAVDPWYNEIKDYNYKNVKSRNGRMIGHFTQVVWLDTTHLGCAKSYSEKSRTLYLVCNYDPPGNWLGDFKEKVPPLQ